MRWVCQAVHKDLILLSCVNIPALRVRFVITTSFSILGRHSHITLMGAVRLSPGL